MKIYYNLKNYALIVIVLSFFLGCGLSQLAEGLVPKQVSELKTDPVLKGIFSKNPKIGVVASPFEYKRQGDTKGEKYITNSFTSLPKLVADVYKKEFRNKNVTFIDSYIEKTGFGFGPTTYDYSSLDADIIIFISGSGTFGEKNGKDFIITGVSHYIIDKQKNEMIGTSRSVLLGNFQWDGKSEFSISRPGGSDSEEWFFTTPKAHVKTVESEVVKAAGELIKKMLK